MDRHAIEAATLTGWRGKVAGVVGPPVARVTPFDEDAVRAAVGAVFFGLSVWYVIGAVRKLRTAGGA